MAGRGPAKETLAAAKTHAPGSYRASAWQVSTREALHSAWRYSIFVTVMKGALPILALGLGVAVLVYILQPRDTERVRLTFEQLDRIQDDHTMVRPQLTGTGDDGQPFTITAASAVQDEKVADKVRLEDVTADIGMSNGATLHVTASHGIADTRLHLLDVSGGIHLTSEDGYDARTEAASADLKSGLIHGEQQVVVTSKFGRVTARRFALNQTTRQLRFSGRVRMLLNPAPQKQAAAGEQEP
jgi:lipopolysaccharide export system protein LptC